MRRVTPILLSAVLVAGCGGREPEADRAAIQARVGAYVGAMLAGDGERACAQFTPRYRREAEQRAGGIGGCAAALELYGEAVAGVLPKDFSVPASTVRVTLDGDAAEAAMRVPQGGLSVKRATLRRVGARWLIDGLGITRPRG